MPPNPPLVIIGASNLIAPYLIKRLKQSGQVAEVISRKPIAVPEGFTLTQMDLTSARNWIAPVDAIVISLIPLWFLAQFLPRFIGVKAIVAVGTTNLFGKPESADERKIAADFQNAEAILREWCKRSLVHYTVLRPTLVYDGKSDKNIARMAKFIRKFHFLPVAAPAEGLRQPIHADDVARAVMGAINNEAAYDKALNIAGGEVLAYRAMAEQVFAALGMKPRLLLLPMEWLTNIFHGVEAFGLFRKESFGNTVFQRMNEDLIFDVAEGLRILNYQPRGFKPEVG
jgi:nucleoside-diphosphate-sugar epimerase